MVACAVAPAAAIAAAASGSVVRGAARLPASPLATAAPAKMATLALAPGSSPQAKLPSHTLLSTSAAAVEQLKLQLQAAAENKDGERVTQVLDVLERSALTKEILETTRIGLTVNNARRQIAESLAVQSKRCRALIKSWQKLLEPHLVSNPSSRNGTPGLVSPAGRRLTPHTPAGRKGTSTGLSSETRCSTLSPANGSYAPKSSTTSPGHAALHKSQSVGGDLTSSGGASATSLDENGTTQGEEARNGKRKGDDISGAVSLKRPKTVSSQLSALHTVPSLSEMRGLTQKTSDLVAGMISGGDPALEQIKSIEEQVRQESADKELAQKLNGLSPPERKKRKYERKQAKTEVKFAVSPPEEERRGGLVLRLTRNATECTLLPASSTSVTTLPTEDNADIPKKEKRKKDKERERSGSSSLEPSKSAPSLATSSVVSALPSISAPSTSSSSARVDWLTMLPSLEQLRLAAEKQKEEDKQEPRIALADPTQVHQIKVRDRTILAMPYIELEDEPDFLKFKYPNPRRFFAEDNFMFGEERPPEAL